MQVQRAAGRAVPRLLTVGLSFSVDESFIKACYDMQVQRAAGRAVPRLSADGDRGRGGGRGWVLGLLIWLLVMQLPEAVFVA